MGNIYPSPVKVLKLVQSVKFETTMNHIINNDSNTYIQKYN